MVLLIAALLLLLVWMLWPKRLRAPGEPSSPHPGGGGSRPEVRVLLSGPGAPAAVPSTCSTGVLPGTLTEDDLIAFGLALESIDEVARDWDADER